MPSARHDKNQIRQAAQIILAPAWERGDVAELRSLNSSKATVSAYFTAENLERLVEVAARWSGDAQGVYVTLNPVLRDCLARSANRETIYAKHTTADNEITHRHWLLIDTDPARPSGISANDAEHNLALERSRQIQTWLQEQGWSAPIVADSGNGGHLLYRIDLPADDGGLVQKVLKALNDRFGDKAVGVDLKVYNPARISKLYGTLAKKGDSLPERPHRIARLLDVPTTIAITPRDRLESIIAAPAAAPILKSPSATSASASGDQFDFAPGFNVVEYLTTHGVEFGKAKSLPDGATLWELKRCVWRPTESDGGPYVIQFANGNIAAGCHHNQCDNKKWADLRDTIDPGWRTVSDKKGSGKGPSVAQQIVTLADGDELFHTAEKEAYVTIDRDGHRETYRLKGDAYKLVLRGRLHQKQMVPPSSALDDAIATLESKAIFDGPEQPVYVRTAQHGDRLYLDLCNDKWEVVEISSEDWQIVSNPPVRFIRHPGMLPLPTPTKGGSITELRELINVTDFDWPLVVSWLMAAIRPTGPYPILLVNGEQGSCKSTTCERVRSVIDPNGSALRDSPKNEQTLMIWAKNSHVIAMDNLSSVSQDLSNAMCRLATGGGRSERSLYTDDTEKLFYAVRPQILNGIGEIATRSDFLDRALTIYLPVIPKSQRKTEKELDARFAQVHGSILGALLTAASHGLKRLPEVEKLQLELPRLADFATWMIAVEAGLGWEEETFLKAITRNEHQSHEVAIADSPVAETVRKFIMQKGQFDDGWTELLAELNDVADEATKRREGWPKNGQSLSTKLRERAPNLRGLGIEVEFHDNVRPKKRVTLKYVQPAYTRPVEPVQVGDYMVTPQIACYDNTPDEQFLAERTLIALIRFWNAPPLDAPTSVVPVAALPQFPANCDGMQVLLGP